VESVYNFSEKEILCFALVLIRVSTLIVSMPVIGGGTIPAPIKVLFALVITFVLFPVVGWKSLTTTLSDLPIIQLAFKEALIGVVFGFTARMFFMVLSISGQIVSVSMGVSSVQLFDPTMDNSSTAFDQFFIILGTLFFLAIQGHHIFIGGLVESYKLIPLSDASLSFVAFKEMGAYLHELTIIGLKLAAPVMVTILFSNIALAVTGRAVPQINILITSLPVNVMMGLFVIMAFLPVLFFEMSGLLNVTAERVFSLLKQM
jgi:flagellar biosynthetic protein FliR